MSVDNPDITSGVVPSMDEIEYSTNSPSPNPWFSNSIQLYSVDIPGWLTINFLLAYPSPPSTTTISFNTFNGPTFIFWIPDPVSPVKSIVLIPTR